MKKIWNIPQITIFSTDIIVTGNNKNRVESVKYCNGTMTSTNTTSFAGYVVAANGQGGATTSSATNGCS